MNDYLSEVFGDGGLFASRFPGYEMREGQVALARMVDEAMRGGRHALGERGPQAHRLTSKDLNTTKAKGP